MLLYAAVLGGSFYGIATLKTGLDLADVAPRDSYFHDFMTKYKRDFLGSSKSAIQVAVDEALDYNGAEPGPAEVKNYFTACPENRRNKS